MNQYNCANPETDSGYTWPQVGFFLNDMFSLQVGFECTHPNASKWEANLKKNFAGFYGDVAADKLMAGLDSIHGLWNGLPENYGTPEYEAFAKRVENETVQGIEKLLAELIVIGETYESELVLL